MPTEPLDPERLHWLATNLLRGTPDDVLRAELLAEGIDAARADDAIATIRRSPAFEAALPFVEDARRLQMLSRRADALLRAVPSARTPRRIPPEAIEAHFEHHLAEGIPLVVTGLATSWPAFERWTWAHLREAHGDAVLEVARAPQPDDGPLPRGFRPRHSLTLASLVDHALDERPRDEADRLYLVASNGALRGPLAALVADLRPDPRLVRLESLAEESHLWLGPRGTRTTWHHDVDHVLMVQLRGRKRVRLVPPTDATMMDHAERTLTDLAFDDPVLEHAFVRETLLEPGDALWIPAGYWHAVEALDPAITVSLTGIVGPRPPRFRLDGTV